MNPTAEISSEISLADFYNKVRPATEKICEPLQIEDYVIQSVVDVSPPKWHLSNSTWFFETFLLKPFLANYKEFDPAYNFVFNSYYETIGARVIRTDRGNLSRPGVEDIYRYRRYVDEHMLILLSGKTESFREVLMLGLNHEQQHQELLMTDIKYILGNNPLLPAYSQNDLESVSLASNIWIDIPEGVYEIGYKGNGFCFDNELQNHKTFLKQFSIQSEIVSNKEYLEFIRDKGYADFRHWHSEGWDWVKTNNISAPMYWYLQDGSWMNYTLKSLLPLEPDQPVSHISFYEASAFAAWKGMRLATEQEWEIASSHFKWGHRWEWTNSAYLPYPGYKKAAGAIGEYNGKFMINQMVLRGASVATPHEHSRSTYRNFFHPSLRWQFTGIRMCK